MADKKETKKAVKAKASRELQRTKKMDLDDDEMLENEDILAKRTTEAAAGAGATGADSSENDDDLEEEREIQKIMKEQINLKK